MHVLLYYIVIYFVYYYVFFRLPQYAILTILTSFKLLYEFMSNLITLLYNITRSFCEHFGVHDHQNIRMTVDFLTHPAGISVIARHKVGLQSTDCRYENHRTRSTSYSILNLTYITLFKQVNLKKASVEMS